MTAVPAPRVHTLNESPPREGGRHVLYWMVAQRRLGWNFALDRAVDHCRERGLPLVALEALRVDYPWASDRHHAFALAGMREHRDRLRDLGVAYHPYVEPRAGAGKGLLEALADQAAVVVTDYFPAFFLPRMTAAAGRSLDVALEAVDSNGLLPLAATPKPFSAAYHFRRYLQRSLGDHLLDVPSSDPFEEVHVGGASIPQSVRSRWPAASDALLEGRPEALAELPINHGVSVSPLAGGAKAGRRRLQSFLEDGLDRYGEQRNHPDANAASGLSPWLHWGHLSAHEVFDAVARTEGWSPARLSDRTDGKRQGWWGMSESAEAFLDELVTWRELGYVFCHHEPGYDRYDGLPEWARDTLAEHAGDPRPWCYGLEEFDRAETHDELWNAAQRELRERGGIHNYLRMLWGKKILEWSPDPRTALDVMVELNNRYALDGRDPNSYSGIFWVLGRFDRGWPERPVFGKVRSMSSDATRRKVRLDDYMERWGSQSGVSL